MVRSFLLASTLLLPSALAAGLYSKASPVLQVDARSYEALIAKSNHTSIVEFYAPWCGHCKNLQPAYEKAAKSLTGLANVAAVNCDDEATKPFCGTMGVQGFPTLKIVRPNTKKPGGRPVVEDYQGARGAKAIVEAVVGKIPNYVTKLKGSELDEWTNTEGPKAILFSDKGSVSATLKALAIDYLGVMSIAQIGHKETAAAKKFDIEKFPTLVLLPGEGQAAVTYKGEMKKEGMLDFLRVVVQPNPPPETRKSKSSTPKDKKSKASKDSSSSSKAPASRASADPTQKSETLEQTGQPTASPDPEVNTQKPVGVPVVQQPIQTLPDGLSLQQKCLNNKSGTCILLLLPEFHPENPFPHTAITSLSEIHDKHEASGRKLFPFYQLPNTNSEAQALRKLLHLDGGVEIIAVNGKRSWWRRYTGVEFKQRHVEDWIDGIRMGEGKKEPLPEKIIVDALELPTEPVIGDPKKVEDLKDKLKDKFPEGIDVEFEELDDLQYENLMKAGKAGDDAKAEKVPISKIHDEL